MKILLSLLLLCAPLTAQLSASLNNFTLNYTAADVVWVNGTPMVVAVVVRPQNAQAYSVRWGVFDNYDSTRARLTRISVHHVWTYESRPCNYGRSVWHNAFDIGGLRLGVQHGPFSSFPMNQPDVLSLDPGPGYMSMDYWLGYCATGWNLHCPSTCATNPEILNYWDSPEMYALLLEVETYPNPHPFP